jgi:amino acid transporter
MFAWVRAGFGTRSGFLAVWFDWIENVVWFPTVPSFAAATLAYIFAFVVPTHTLSLVAGLMQALQAFFIKLGPASWTTKLMAALVGLGTLALISTWMIGPSKGVYAAEDTGELPPALHYVNRRHVPVAGQRSWCW